MEQAQKESVDPNRTLYQRVTTALLGIRTETAPELAEKDGGREVLVGSLGVSDARIDRLASGKALAYTVPVGN